MEIEDNARVTAADMEPTVPERFARFWVVVDRAVDKEETLVLARVLNEVAVEFVVEIAVDKEETAVEAEVLNAVTDVVSDVMADPVVRER